MDLPAFLQAVMRQLPLPAQQLFGEEYLAQFSASGAVAFGYNHPFVLVMLSLAAILVPSRHVAGEIEDGALELLLALPVRRQAVACTLWLGARQPRDNARRAREGHPWRREKNVSQQPCRGPFTTSASGDSVRVNASPSPMNE